MAEIIISSFVGDKKSTKGVLPVYIEVGTSKSKTFFFIIEGRPIFNALLCRDWINSNKCIPSFMDQKLLLMNEDGLVLKQIFTRRIWGQ